MIQVSTLTMLLNAYIFYHEATSRRIISIEKMLQYQKNVEAFWSKNGVEVSFKDNIATALKENPNLFEFVTGDNVIVIKNNVDVQLLKDSIKEEIPDEVQMAFEDASVKNDLL